MHTLVLLCIFSSRVILINHHGLKLAEFPAESIRFVEKLSPGMNELTISGFVESVQMIEGSLAW